ncbi:hypothetical protein GCM10025877_09360 [Agromyces mangrovi Wang et al. 2018]|nr:hypothetical protein GCM10025877_09360 [Agromyces mangrovi]
MQHELAEHGTRGGARQAGGGADEHHAHESREREREHDRERAGRMPPPTTCESDATSVADAATNHPRATRCHLALTRTAYVNAPRPAHRSARGRGGQRPDQSGATSSVNELVVPVLGT